MSLKGGYKIIDLKGIDVTSSTMMIDGIYESIENNYGKPLLISGIVIDGVEKDDVFVQTTLNGTAYEFEIYGYTYQVQDTDAVGVKKIITLQKEDEVDEINLKNGDCYYLKSIDTWNGEPFFRANNIKNYVFSLLGDDIVPSHILYSLLITNDNNTLKMSFSIVTGDVNNKNMIISRFNDIVYITQVGEI